MKTIGILGAGQLGCMLAESLFKWGATVRFLDPDANAPGKQRTPFFTCGEWTDKQKVSEFFASCDVVTYEFENVSVELLESVSAKTGVPLWPGAPLLATTQNRIEEKLFFQKNNLPHAGFDIIDSTEKLESQFNPLLNSQLSQLLPRILKTARGGYDGKGQWMLRNQADLQLCLQNLNQSQQNFPLCVLEQMVPLWREASCIVARNEHGQCETFPIFENIHEHHILAASLCPARIPAAAQQTMQNIAIECAQKLNVVGLLTVEFFLSEIPAPNSNGHKTENHYLYINELAPRPHNSGHITRTACNGSQFDAMARILLGLPLFKPQMVNSKIHAMGNLMGDLWPSENCNPSFASLNQCGNLNEVVLYGKTTARPGRKMGHFNLHSDSHEQALASLNLFQQKLTSDSSDFISTHF